MAKSKIANDVGWAGECRASDASLKCDHTAGWDYPDKSTRLPTSKTTVNSGSTRDSASRGSSSGGREA